MVLPSVSGLVECHVRVSKAAGDRALTSASGETVSLSASVLNWHGRQRPQSGLTLEAALPMAPAQLASAHFPTHPSGLGICSRRGGSSSSGRGTLGRQ